MNIKKKRKKYEDKTNEQDCDVGFHALRIFILIVLS